MKKMIVAIAALALMAGSAYAADWNFYGSARVATFWSDADVIDGADGDLQLSESLQGNSRIGAKVKVSDELTGGFEYGASKGNANIRKLYGEWDFGGGKLKVGQDYTPLNWFYSNQVYDADNELLAQGGIYSARQAQICVSFGGFKLAFMSPDDAGGDSNVVADQVTLPAIEASYQLALDMVAIDFGAGYSTYEAAAGDVDSYVLAVGAAFNVAGFFLNGDIFYGQNVGHIMVVSVDGDDAWDDGYAATINGEIVDNDCFGFLLVAGYKINDMFTVEAGYGYAQTELDVSGADKDKVASYYVNATVNFAPGVFIVPEVGFFDGDESGDWEKVYYGLKWQINF